MLLEEVSKFVKLDSTKISALKRLGIISARDLILNKPYDYKKRLIFPSISSIKNGEEVIIKGKVIEIKFPEKKGRPIKIAIGNETGSISITYFTYSGFLKTIFRLGNIVTISGKVEFFDFYPQISHPEIIFENDLITILEPKYHLTYGITNSQIRSIILKLLKKIPQIDEWLPEEIIAKYKLPTFLDAIKSIHIFPESHVTIKKAYERLRFDEIMANQLSFKYIRSSCAKEKPNIYNPDHKLQNQIMSKLPFELTEEQKKVITEIEQEQLSQNQMLRMVQGDVGSGKTIVSILVSSNVLSKNGQVALMAPTEVLARQHYNLVKKLLEDTGYESILITSKTKSKDKIKEKILEGEINFVVGTHSLLQENVKFKNLGFVIVDEQHKFGVGQRMELVSKGEHPDVLIMSATPIPRSLALTLFGDLSISTIKSKPKNRKEIKTFVSSISKLNDVINAIKTKIDKKEKIYWICPLIENDMEKNELEYIDVQTRYNFLKPIFGENIGILHGKLKPEEKEKIINEFYDGTINILVSTTVVEVGVDVPDATLIIIENAEKFGLAQLHQLRGRVGRSDLESSCILLYGKRSSKIAFERLKIMKESNDGFLIAEKDLSLRGEGELFGERQSGDVGFIFVDLANNISIIEECASTAKDLEIDKTRSKLLALFNPILFSKSLLV